LPRRPRSTSRRVPAVFDAAFDDAIEAVSEVDSWICGFALAGIDLQPFLAKLEASAAAKALRQFVGYNDAYRSHGALKNAFWERHRSALAPVGTRRHP
jgi:hypothetical protein